MKKSSIICALLTIATAFGISSCGEIKRGEYASGTAAVFCDDGFKNILDEEIQAFEFSYKDATIVPFYMSEQACIDSLMQDKCQSIIITRDFTKEERAHIKSQNKRIVRSNCIAVDAVALIVNKDNPVSALSVDEIGKILRGEITRWSQLAGNDTTAIKVVFDAEGSSTVSYMREKFIPEGKKITDFIKPYAQKNNAQVFDVVKKDPDALGIISVSWLGNDLSVAKQVPMEERMEDYANENDSINTELTEEVNIIKVSNPNEDNDFSPVAYKPYQLYINSGEYPLFRKVWMISTASNSTVLHSFYTFVTGFVGQKIIIKSGIMPYHVHSRVVQVVK
ncbi:MAG: substrate-binding domain-containing protein [Muribaculaceae bacterium]|nr:substrate-binding domain-containing protein [Muribaculaceae bacterium]